MHALQTVRQLASSLAGSAGRLTSNLSTCSSVLVLQRQTQTVAAATLLPPTAAARLTQAGFSTAAAREQWNPIYAHMRGETGAATGQPTAAGTSAAQGAFAGGSFTGAPTSEQQTGQQSYAGPPKLVVFGGNGFVGSRVCQEALKTGLKVLSINRSGRPRQSGSWVSDVQWVPGDAFKPEQWRDHLQGAVAVISTMGLIGPSNEKMYKICGKANILAINEAADAQVPRFVMISAHDFGFPSFVLEGYNRGKRDAERALASRFPASGIALRPGFIYGTKSVFGLPLPLGLVGAPLQKALSLVPSQSLAQVPLVGAGFVPPVPVEAVAAAAVRAATDPAVPAGVMDVWEIAQFKQV